MKFLSFNRIAVYAITCLLITLFSCRKEGSQSAQAVTEEQAIAYAEESMEAEASYDDVQDISMIAADEEGITSAGRGTEDRRPFPFFELRQRIGNCAVITVTPDDSTYPKTVVIDFGDGCGGPGGKFRKGAIILHFTGPIRRPGSVLTVTLRDFYLNRVHIEGTKVISNLSENGNIKFTVQIINGKVSFPNGRGYTYNALKYVQQLEGGATAAIPDDIYSIEGRSATVFANGVSVTLNTETPLIKKAACHWISEGNLKIKINDRELFLDYGAPGDGDCDNKALLTWNDGNNQRLIPIP